MVDDLTKATAGELADRALGLDTGKERPRTQVKLGDPAIALVSVQQRGQARLVVVGSRGLGAVKRMALGSVSTRLLRGATGSVLIVPQPARSLAGGRKKLA